MRALLIAAAIAFAALVAAPAGAAPLATPSSTTVVATTPSVAVEPVHYRYRRGYYYYGPRFVYVPRVYGYYYAPRHHYYRHYRRYW